MFIFTNYIMRYALQIYGVFRTFEKCLPQILKYISYYDFKYDVFILSQRIDGYSIENEQKIRQMLNDTNHTVIWKYIEDYSHNVHLCEDVFCAKYDNCIKNAKQQIQNNLVTNDFVTRLWYRRWLNNHMRIEYEQVNKIKYDWVVRTRFDIGYKTVVNHKSLDILLKPPEDNTIYMFPDIITCGSPEVVNYESNLIHMWPYIYNQYIRTGKLSDHLHGNSQIISKWLMMSELNLINYIEDSSLHMKILPKDLTIIRRNSSVKTDLSDEHITSIWYGCDDHWIDVTYILSKYANTKIPVANRTFNCDPCEGIRKRLVIQTLENNEYIYDEGTTFEFKYQHVHTIGSLIPNLQSVKYGLGTKHIDVTSAFVDCYKKYGSVVVNNQLTDRDPCPGEHKAVLIIMKDGRKHTCEEYSFIL